MGASDEIALGIGLAAVLGVGVFVLLSKKAPLPTAAISATTASPVPAKVTPSATATPAAAATVTPSATQQAATPAAAAVGAAAAPIPVASSSLLAGISASAGPLAITIGANVAKQIAVSAADKAIAKLAGKNIAREAALRLSQKAAAAASKCGIKAVEKMGVKIGVKLAEMGAEAAAEAAMGPVGWAALAFDVFSLGLDIGDVGGYGNMQTLDALYKQRDALRKKAASTDPNAPFPFVVGPLTQLAAADSQALFGQVVTDAVTDKMTDFVATLDGKSDADQDSAINAEIDSLSDYYASDAGFAELFSRACVAKGGSPYGNDCSYATADACNSSYKWPIADSSSDIFTHWTGDHCEASAAQTLRQTCTDLGLDWDFSEEVCKLTSQYCATKGGSVRGNSKHNNATDCTIPLAQQGLEAIFGTTITRGLKQIFDPSQYEKCNSDEWDATSMPTAFKVFLDMSPLAHTINYFCFKKGSSCATGLEASHGLCYTPCKDGYKSDGATLCYKQYPGWEQNDATTVTNVGEVLHANPGKPLSTCGPDQDKDGALCYPKCAANEYGVGPVCWTSCPSGYSDGGVFCSKPSSYGRGAGYPWKFGDKAFDYGPAGDRCNKDNPQGCEKSGLIWYPRCKSGFHAVGCCVCSPDCPTGTTDTGATCTKNTHGRGAGSPLQCAAGQTQDSPGLCYDACPTGLHKSTLGMCTSGCPDGATNIGVSCMRESYSRGVGVLPWSMRAKKRLVPYSTRKN